MLTGACRHFVREHGPCDLVRNPYTSHRALTASASERYRSSKHSWNIWSGTCRWLIALVAAGSPGACQASSDFDSDLTRTKGTGEFIRNAQLEDESFGWAHLGGETPDG